MGHCPACGADLWDSNETYVHLLGCGAALTDSPDVGDRRCPVHRATQQRILAEALEQAFGDQEAGARVDALAKAIEDRLAYFAGLSENERERYPSGEVRRKRGRGEELIRELAHIRKQVEELDARLSNDRGST